MADEAWVGLAEAIGAIRSELQQAARDGAGQEIQFRTGPVEVEFSVDVKKDGEARAKVLVLPFGAEAKASRSKGTASRVKITLQPVDAEGEDRRIGDESKERPK
ncbi:trypco2 family protein [Streptomyces albicerus]|uniref:trypco2 family protein n=1 Tax=Streptomyces albicerus TaxID=2569859 RepID=UPI001CED5A73|nr:trypco2 family protein [Streptomyces albicerus]